jgi:hypothetical protein
MPAKESKEIHNTVPPVSAPPQLYAYLTIGTGNLGRIFPADLGVRLDSLLLLRATACSLYPMSCNVREYVMDWVESKIGISIGLLPIQLKSTRICKKWRSLNATNPQLSPWTPASVGPDVRRLL